MYQEKLLDYMSSFAMISSINLASFKYDVEDNPFVFLNFLDFGRGEIRHVKILRWSVINETVHLFYYPHLRPYANRVH